MPSISRTNPGYGQVLRGALDKMDDISDLARSGAIPCFYCDEVAVEVEVLMPVDPHGQIQRTLNVNRPIRFASHLLQLRPQASLRSFFKILW